VIDLLFIPLSSLRKLKPVTRVTEPSRPKSSLLQHELPVERLAEHKLEWSLKMKRIDVQSFALLTALAVLLSISSASRAQNASESLYKSKCAACHSADGSGSAMGKKLGAHDFQTAEVQKISDAELSDIITNGKNKMPAYGKSLKADDIKGLVAYIRTLKK
jgi:cytochrome c6